LLGLSVCLPACLLLCPAKWVRACYARLLAALKVGLPVCLAK
jgi:hypothetical protein